MAARQSSYSKLKFELEVTKVSLAIAEKRLNCVAHEKAVAERALAGLNRLQDRTESARKQLLDDVQALAYENQALHEARQHDRIFLDMAHNRLDSLRSRGLLARILNL